MMCVVFFRAMRILALAIYFKLPNSSFSCPPNFPFLYFKNSATPYNSYLSIQFFIFFLKIFSFLFLANTEPTPKQLIR